MGLDHREVSWIRVDAPSRSDTKAGRWNFCVEIFRSWNRSVDFHNSTRRCFDSTKVVLGGETVVTRERSAILYRIFRWISCNHVGNLWRYFVHFGNLLILLKFDFRLKLWIGFLDFIMFFWKDYYNSG